MNNLETSIKDCISKELEKGIIEEVLKEKLKESIEEAVKDLFGWGGDVKKVIEDKIKSVMIPYLENYDYSEYITKLDSVLVDVLKSSALPHKKLLENFKVLMFSDKEIKSIKLSEIYDKWCNYCIEKIDKNNIEGYDYEGGYINVRMSVEETSHDWSNFETHIVTFECEEDEDLNIEFTIDKWKNHDKDYSLHWHNARDIESLKYLNEFDIFMMKLNQACTKIELDTEYESDELHIEYEE